MSAALEHATDAGGWRHACAIALLPLMNTVVIPAVLLMWWPSQAPAGGVALTLLLLGGMLAAAGIALVAHSIALFVRRGRGTLAPWDPTKALVSAGAYRYSRNPMKAGLFLVLAGEALATQSVALAVWFCAFMLVNVVYIRFHEEPGLERRFGDGYRDYCARVPRWWPRLRAQRNHTLETTTS